MGEALAIHHHRAYARRLLVAHIKYLIARAKILFRGAMAVQAPLHLQRGLLVHERHLVDGAVAGVAAHTFIDMNAVIEEDEVGKLVHPRPLQRLPRAVAGADRLQQFGIGPDLRMAVHASLGGRNTGEARGLDRGVAVAAVNAESGDVMLVAERHRLRPAHSGIGDVGRALHLHRDPAERGNHEDRAKNRGPGHGVGAAMKNLRHACVRTLENTNETRQTPVCRSVMVTAQKTIPAESFAPPMRTGDYKYFARSCRAFCPRRLENVPKLNSAENKFGSVGDRTEPPLPL